MQYVIRMPNIILLLFYFFYELFVLKKLNVYTYVSFLFWVIISINSSRFNNDYMIDAKSSSVSFTFSFIVSE